MANKIWLVWNRDSFVWNKVDLIWSEAWVWEEVEGKYRGGPLAMEEERPWKSLEDDMKEKGVSEEAREKLLEIVIKYNGLDKKITRLSEAKSPKVTVEHVRKAFATAIPEVRVVINEGKITESRGVQQ